MFGNNTKLQTPAVDPSGSPRITEVLEYDGIVVNPVAVTLDAARGRLIVVVRAVSPDPSSQAAINLLLARISAYVVAGTLEHALPGMVVELYLRYPGDIDVAVDAELAQTAQRIKDRREQLRRCARNTNGHAPPVIPGQVLAYVLSTLQRR